MWSPPLIENWDFKGKTFCCIRTVFSECRFEWKLLLEFWSPCAVRLQPRLATNLSGPFWILSSTRKMGASLAKAFDFFQDNKWLGICLTRGDRESTLNCLLQPVTIPCHCSSFFGQGGGQQHCHCTLAGPVLAYCVTAGAHWRPQSHHPNGRGCTQYDLTTGRICSSVFPFVC